MLTMFRLTGFEAVPDDFSKVIEETRKKYPAPAQRPSRSASAISPLCGCVNMLYSFGRLVSRFWYLVLVVWLLLLTACWSAAPPWSEVAQDREFAFLPADAPSRRAEEIFAKAFPDDRLASNLVLVLHRPGPETGSLEGDLKFIEDTFEPALRKIATSEGGLASDAAPPDGDLFGDKPPKPETPVQRPRIARIRTPNDPEAGPLMVSDDGKALLVVLELTTEFLSKENWPTIDKIRSLVKDLGDQGKIPAGMKITVAGGAIIGRDHVEGELQSAHATEVLTIVLVIVLLLLIYRAPIIALIPLVTVFLVVEISVHALAILGKAGYIQLFEGIQIYITILTYGAGIDYCLFFTARYREELEHGTSPAEAVAQAIEGIGAAVAASAGTVIIGIGMMTFAQFGKFHEAGYAVPLQYLSGLVRLADIHAGSYRLAGHWAFWPRHLEKLDRASYTPLGGRWRPGSLRFGTCGRPLGNCCCAGRECCGSARW